MSELKAVLEDLTGHESPAQLEAEDYLIPAMESRLDALIDMREKLLAAPRLTMALAMEADALVLDPSFSRTFFSEQAVSAKHEIALEEVQVHIVAAIVAAIGVIAGIIYYLIYGRKKDGEEVSTPEDIRETLKEADAVAASVPEVSIPSAYRKHLEQQLAHRMEKGSRGIAFLFNDNYANACVALAKAQEAVNEKAIVDLIGNFRAKVTAKMPEHGDVWEKIGGMSHEQVQGYVARMDAIMDELFKKPEEELRNLDRAVGEYKTAMVATAGQGFSATGPHYEQAASHLTRFITGPILKVSFDSLERMKDAASGNRDGLKKLKEDVQGMEKQLSGNAFGQSLLRGYRRLVQLFGHYVKSIETSRNQTVERVKDVRHAASLLASAAVVAADDKTLPKDQREEEFETKMRQQAQAFTRLAKTLSKIK